MTAIFAASCAMMLMHLAIECAAVRFMVLVLEVSHEVREDRCLHSALRSEAHEFADAAVALHSRDGVDGVTNRIIFGHVVEDSQTEAATDGSAYY